jgi:putative SOS response-associated peptidase YedK
LVLVEAFPVSTQVNNVRNDAAELMEPMKPA